MEFFGHIWSKLGEAIGGVCAGERARAHLCGSGVRVKAGGLAATPESTALVPRLQGAGASASSAGPAVDCSREQEQGPEDLRLQIAVKLMAALRDGTMESMVTILADQAAAELESARLNAKRAFRESLASGRLEELLQGLEFADLEVDFVAAEAAAESHLQVAAETAAAAPPAEAPPPPPRAAVERPEAEVASDFSEVADLPEAEVGAEPTELSGWWGARPPPSPPVAHTWDAEVDTESEAAEPPAESARLRLPAAEPPLTAAVLATATEPAEPGAGAGPPAALDPKEQKPEDLRRQIAVRLVAAVQDGTMESTVTRLAGQAAAELEAARHSARKAFRESLASGRLEELLQELEVEAEEAEWSEAEIAADTTERPERWEATALPLPRVAEPWEVAVNTKTAAAEPPTESWPLRPPSAKPP